MTPNRGSELIVELLSDPAAFEEKHGPYALLQEYFRGMELDTLRPLLKHPDVLVQRAAAFIASELGRKGHSLADAVIPLAQSPDPDVAYDATLALTAFSDVSDSDARNFVHVLHNLEHADEAVRRVTMRMASNVSLATLLAAGERFSGPSATEHAHGLRLVVEAEQHPHKVTDALDHSSPLVRRYAGVAARRLLKSKPDLIQKAALSKDHDVREFASLELNPPSIDSVLPPAPGETQGDP